MKKVTSNDQALRYLEVVSDENYAMYCEPPAVLQDIRRINSSYSNMLLNWMANLAENVAMKNYINRMKMMKEVFDYLGVEVIDDNSILKFKDPSNENDHTYELHSLRGINLARKLLALKISTIS
ncbi:MAG: hypothetical protein ACRCXZ_01675 [Patescibacteria group bacterium]